MARQRITWLDTPASFGAEATLSDGTVMQFTALRSGHSPVRASSRMADGHWFNMGALDTARWGIPESQREFREIVEDFVDEVGDQSIGGDVDRFLREQGQPSRLDEFIGQPVSGYPSSPAHDARAISQYVRERYGSDPKHVSSGRGNAYRVTLPDGREQFARVDGTAVTLHDEWWPQGRGAQPMTTEVIDAQPSLVNPPDYADVGPDEQAQPAVIEEQSVAADAASEEMQDPLVWMLGSMNGGGVVVDHVAARTGPCYDIDLGDGKHASLHDGVLYPLNAEQEALYCMTREQIAVPAETRARIRRYADAAQSCMQPVVADEGAEAVLQCLARELKG